MGMFPEDHRIHIPTLIKLWVDEGFVKPVAGKSLESIAREVYLHGLVIRILILVREWGPTRRIKRCAIHDLLRGLILLQVLDCLKKTMGSEDSEYEELGQKLYQSLYGRRYLIVMDDIWGTDAWDGVKRFFPDNKDRSKVLLTTRLSNVALQLDGPDYFQMPFLKVDESWNLLRRCVFQKQQGCPSELEEIGKDIATNCGGLPLSIVVIGGLLAKSERTRENWQHVLENLSSIVNLEEDERCFRILKLSYNQLPVHLKPCFLYMGMFPEDHMIHVPTLLKLWVDEGFVKTVAGKSLESIAREVYLHGLVIRNLILSLFGRRYLIVMDDIWGTVAWDRVKPFFPDNNNGSRVLITTRLLKVALQLDGPNYFQM
ncbi:disease resistance protein RGH3, partial [Striga asiatica]